MGGDRRLARVDDLPLELDAGRVEDAAGRLRQLRTDAVAGDQGDSVGHAAILATLRGRRRPARRQGEPAGGSASSARDRLPGCDPLLVGRCELERNDDRFPTAVGHDGEDRPADDVRGQQALPIGRPGSGAAKRRIGKVWVILAIPGELRIRPHLHGGAGQSPGRLGDDGAIAPIRDPRSVGRPRRPETAIDGCQVAAREVENVDGAPGTVRWSRGRDDQPRDQATTRPNSVSTRSGPTACRSAPSGRTTYTVPSPPSTSVASNEGDSIPCR